MSQQLSEGLDSGRRALATAAPPAAPAAPAVAAAASVPGDHDPASATVTGQASLSRAVKLLSSCSTALMQAHTEQELLASICALAVDVAGYAMAWVGLPDGSADYLIVPSVAVGGGADLGRLDAALRAAPTAVRTAHPARRAFTSARGHHR
ncbi:hypothetical protein [Massilia sp. PWRC2]|uniref:hypothetical protein n=1 Tax=Massilia sp. PWRC2 TaxID=2804626 RepID=UPI003CEC46DF